MREPSVVLIAGPSGSGKSSIAARIGQHPNWQHVSEDNYWVRIKEGRPWGEPRTTEEQQIVQGEVLRQVANLIENGTSVALEFILYEDPPAPLINYQRAFSSRQIACATRILRPDVDEVMRRIAARGRPRDTDLANRRAQIEHQVRCLDSPHIQSDWILDTSLLSLEEVYSGHFRDLVEN